MRMRDLPFSHHPDFPAALQAIRNNLMLGNEYMAGMALVLIEIIDHVPARDAHLIQERLLKQAYTVVDKTLRTDNHERRKVPDVCFRFGSVLVACLGNVTPETVAVPLGRAANQIRNEFYGSGDATAMKARRQVNLAVSLWDPRHGFLNEEKFIERAFEALEMLWAGDGIPDAHDYLRMAPSALDTWAVAVAEALPGRSGRTGPIAEPDAGQGSRSDSRQPAAGETGKEARPAAHGNPTRAASSTRRPAVVTKRLDREPPREPEKDKSGDKKGWMFWK